MNFGKQLKEGLLTENPVLVQLLGMCSTLAITTSISNGLGMGVSVLIILTCSNIVISLLRKIIPDQIRIAAYIVVIAGFVTMVDLLLQAYFQDIAESLGVFIPLIVVNCIILARAESFASKNKVLPAALDGICQGIGYTLVLLVMSAIREFLGSGSLVDLEQFGIKEVQVGPFKKGEGNDGDAWEWFYIPCPTSIFSEHWGTNGDKAGQRPLAVQVEESASMYYGTLEEMIAKMGEFDRPMVLFQL